MAQNDEDWGTHKQDPRDVWKNESEREKFDDWLAVWHWVVYGVVFVMGIGGLVFAACH